MSDLKQILVIGPGSLTGSRFIELLDERIEVYGAGGKMDENTPKLKSFQNLDITSDQNVSEVIQNYPGQYVVNFAGATLVDEIEKGRPDDPDNLEELADNLAVKINVLGTKNIAAACQNLGKTPVFISTDFVFDGENGPYKEDDQTCQSPEDVSWYAWTKMLAEKEALGNGEDQILMVRIAYPYRNEYEGKMDFARTFLKLYDTFKSGERDNIYPIFADQALTPTLIDDLAPGISFLIKQNARGIYHLASPEITTPYDFCVELLRVARGLKDPTGIINKGNIEEFQKAHPEIAKRPVKGGLKSDKILKLGFTSTSWKKGIKKAFG